MGTDPCLCLKDSIRLYAAPMMRETTAKSSGSLGEPKVASIGIGDSADIAGDEEGAGFRPEKTFSGGEEGAGFRPKKASSGSTSSATCERVLIFGRLTRDVPAQAVSRDSGVLLSSSMSVSSLISASIAIGPLSSAIGSTLNTVANWIRFLKLTLCLFRSKNPI